MDSSKLYRIAVVTDDGERVSSHFGMASVYRIFTIENDQIVGDESRSKPHHEKHPNHHVHHGGQHDTFGHSDMFAPVSDCQVLVCGGMGTPAYQRAVQSGMEVVMVGGTASDVVKTYLNGEISSDMRRVHQH